MTIRLIILSALVSLYAHPAFSEDGGGESYAPTQEGEFYAAAGDPNAKVESGTGRNSLLDPSGPLDTGKANEQRRDPMENREGVSHDVDDYEFPSGRDVMQPHTSELEPDKDAVLKANPPPQSIIGVQEDQKTLYPDNQLGLYDNK